MPRVMPKGIFNELMVKDGYAMPYERYVPRELKSKYHKLSKVAKSFNRGLWKYYNIDCMGKSLNYYTIIHSP